MRSAHRRSAGGRFSHRERRRVAAAADVSRGRIAVRGWRARLPLTPADVLPGLERYCAAFLCTDVHNEGTLRGARLPFFRALGRLASRPMIAAGGIRSRADVRALARSGIDAAIGMAMYTGVMGDE